MDNFTVSTNQGFCKSFSRFSGIFSIVMGGIALAGWAFNIAVFKSIVPHLSSMNPMTAICFILLGSSLLIHHSSYNTLRYLIATACTLFVLSLALSRLGNILFGFNFNPDQLLFTAQLGTNHMAPNTAFNFFILSFSQLSLRYPRNPYRQFLILLAGMISFMALVGYAYDVHALYEMPTFISMALNTATTFFILSCGMLGFDPDYGFMRILTNDGISGILTRRILPQGVAILVILGWLRLMGQRLKLYNPEVGVLIFLLLVMVVFIILIWYNAIILERIDVERQEKVKALRESEQRFDLATRSAKLGVWDLDLVNDKAIRSLRHDQIFGYSTLQSEWGAKIFLEHVLPLDRETVDKSFKEAMETDHFKMECRIVWPDQSIHWIAAYGHIYRDPQGVPSRMLGTVIDIDEQKRAQDEIQEKTNELKEAHDALEVLSLTDPLTGVFNRRGFNTHVQERLKSTRRDKQNTFLLFIDIDKMKWINDTLGHKEGDSALIEVANILKKCSRDTDIIARLGGDEFTMFLSITNVGDENIVIKRLQECVDQRNAVCELPHHPFSLSVGGVACNPEENYDLETLISHADKKMYVEKGSKKRQ